MSYGQPVHTDGNPFFQDIYQASDPEHSQHSNPESVFLQNFYTLLYSPQVLPDSENTPDYPHSALSIRNNTAEVPVL